jgi:hypothetical protein
VEDRRPAVGIFLVFIYLMQVSEHPTGSAGQEHITIDG